MMQKWTPKAVQYVSRPGALASVFLLFMVMLGIAKEDQLRRDENAQVGELNVGVWIALIIGAMVLVIVVSALWTTFTTALNNYSTNETTFGPTVKTLTPILVGVGILLAFVAAFLPRYIGHGG